MKSAIVVSNLLLVSCVGTSDKSFTTEQIVKVCLDQKEKAEAPEATVSFSNSKKGNNVGLSLSFSSDFVRGADPNTVYSDCVKKLSNE